MILCICEMSVLSDIGEVCEVWCESVWELMCQKRMYVKWFCEKNVWGVGKVV